MLDMIMDPGMDGLETYRKIIEIHPGQKAIIASGFSETNRVKELQSLGAGAYIRKPLLLEKIDLAVKEELEKQAAFGGYGGVCFSPQKIFVVNEKGEILWTSFQPICRG